MSLLGREVCGGREGYSTTLYRYFDEGLGDTIFGI